MSGRMTSLWMRHDLATAYAELFVAARHVPSQEYDSKVFSELAAKAVSFTLQLAVDSVGSSSDVTQLRALEQALHDFLQEKAVRPSS